jgi:uncharacterized membrane protein HdeD (DUF308 family)
VATSLVVAACGAAMTLRPELGALATVLILSAALVVDGGFRLALALRLRPLGAWRWVLGSALASLLAGAFLAAGFPARSGPALGLMLAVAWVTTGLGLLALAVRDRPAADRT